jgi:hypothetical protein
VAKQDARLVFDKVRPLEIDFDFASALRAVEQGNAGTEDIDERPSA